MTTTNQRTPNECRAIALTIQDQIPTRLRWAVGYRHGAITQTGLRFQVRGRGHYIVNVDYDLGSDLYNVTVATKNASRSRVFHTAEQIDVEQMVEIIDHIDRGIIKAGS